MHYFSLATLNRRSPKAKQHLRELSQHGEAYRDHCLIWKLFPAEVSQRPFIFRRRQKDSELGYYIVSSTPPQADEDLFTLHAPGPKNYTPQLGVGEWVRFELQANPTISRKFGVPGSDGRRRSKRHDLLTDVLAHTTRDDPAAQAAKSAAVDQAALHWLLAHAPHWGLEPDSESILTSGYTQHRLRSRGRLIQFSSLDYTGMARVTEPECLAAALTEGVGHARSFGCGLLLVRRVE